MSAADNYRDTLIAIIEKSATLAERLSGEFVPINDPTEADIIETRLKTWIQTAAQGDPERFRKRLEWDGLTLEQVKPLLGSVRRRDPDAPLPRWAELLGEVLHEIQGTPELHDFRFNYANPLPFEEILVSFGSVAWRQSQSAIIRKVYTYTGEMLPMLFVELQSRHNLLPRLSYLAAPTLIIAFKTFQVLEYGTSLTDETPESIVKPTYERYSAFVKSILSSELTSFFIDYASLARILATTTLFWIDSAVEFATQILTTEDVISKTFNVRPRIGVGLHFGLSDSHNSGRSAAKVPFSQDLMYKPKSLSMELGLNQFLEWIEGKNSAFAFKRINILTQHDYGWMEFIKRGYFGTDEQVQNYYQNAGAFLTLIHTLAANDCHSANIIIDGKQPVLVDAETLMHHRVPDGEYHFPDAHAAAHAIIENSVLRTQFLPKWEINADGSSYDMSGIGGKEYQESTVRRSKWVYVNTDYMSIGYEQISAESQDAVVNVISTLFPIINLKKLNPNGYETEIISGFTEMYRFLMAHREELLAEGSPLEGFKNQRVRYVFRPTQTYQTVLQHTLQPRYLHEGIDRSIQIESLNRVLLAWDEKPVFWDIHKGEAQAMEQMDVPLLTYNSSDTSLHIGDITIENVFDRPAHNLVIERLNSMSEDDLQQQIAFIRGSLFCRIAHELPDTEDEIPAVLQNAPTLPRELLMSEAGQIADELQARAIWGEDGSATWITLTYHFAANRYQFGQISDGLYDGTCGVAFFLAALHHVTGWPGARELGLAAIKPLQNRLYHPVLSQRLARHLGVNGPSGLKSIAYALRQISEWLDEPRLLEGVRRVENLINPALDAAEKKAGRIPENVFAQSAGRWHIESRLPDGVQLWGLYGGRAGIGYELLKLLDTHLPSIPF